MNNILLIGINHRTAPIDIRENVSFSDDETQKALLQLVSHANISEAFFLSTCNRTEALVVTDNIRLANEEILQTIRQTKGISADLLHPYIYIYESADAVRHLFEVASGLDSMVLGEPQILGQVKHAYHLAGELKTTRAILNRLLHRTFFVAKKVRTETGIGDKAVSASYVAIELARKIFDRLEGQKTLLIGAGEMAELAVTHLQQYHCGDIFVANRTFERALSLADRFGGRAAKFEEIPRLLETTDIIISSTGSSERIISASDLKPIMKKRRNRPLFFVDIAVPRDIDPAINRMENAYVYDIDDLQSVILDNLQNRQNEAIKAQSLIEEGVVRFCQWQKGLDLVPVIIQLRKQVTNLVQAEVEKSLGPLLETEEVQEATNRMTEAIVSKMIHHPVQYLKKPDSHTGLSTETLSIVRTLFDLKDDSFE